MRSALGSATEIPLSIKARLLNGLGSGMEDPVPDIHAWLVDKQGYSDPIGADASVISLRSVGGDGVFYISSHAQADAADDLPFNIWTSTETNGNCEPESTAVCPDPLLPNDIKDKRVGAYIADNQYDPAKDEYTAESHYGIKTEFVSKYWHDFGGNAFVYIDTCESDKSDPSVEAFKNALRALRASVYAGWTDAVGFDMAGSTTRLVFDRLVGANQFCPEDGQPTCAKVAAAPPTFAQRSFDYTQVAMDLPLHQLGEDGETKLVFEPLTGSFGLLAPSISNMSVDETMVEAGRITINGAYWPESPAKRIGSSGRYGCSDQILET